MTKPTIQIKNAQSTDLDKAFRVIHECNIALQKEGMNNWERYTEEKVLNIIQSNEMYLLVVGNEVNGTIKISRKPPNFYNARDMEKWEKPNGKAFYFTALAISPQSQGKGYGSLLINFAEEYAKKEEAEYLRMTMFAKNKALKSYYLNRGFTFSQERNVEELNLKLLFGEKKLT